MAVKKAIDSGRITPEPDGTIEPNRADLEWARNTVPARKAAPVKATPAAVESPRARLQETPEPVAPALSAGGASLLQARTVNEVVKAQTNKVRLAQLKGELVDRAQPSPTSSSWAGRTGGVDQLAESHHADPRSGTGIDEHTLFVALDVADGVHLEELGEFVPKQDG